MITILKLVDGTEVAGILEEETSNHVMLKNPLQINYRHVMSSSTPSVSFSRYMMFADANVIAFDKFHVMNRSFARPEFKGFYLSAISQIEETLDPQIKQELMDGDDLAFDQTDKESMYDAILRSLDSNNMTPQ